MSRNQNRSATPTVWSNGQTNGVQVIRQQATSENILTEAVSKLYRDGRKGAFGIHFSQEMERLFRRRMGLEKDDCGLLEDVFGPALNEILSDTFSEDTCMQYLSEYSIVQPFANPLSNGERVEWSNSPMNDIGGRLDAVAWNNATSKLAIVEMKTNSMPANADDVYVNQRDVIQVFMYCMLLMKQLAQIESNLRSMSRSSEQLVALLRGMQEFRAFIVVLRIFESKDGADAFRFYSYEVCIESRWISDFQQGGNEIICSALRLQMPPESSKTWKKWKDLFQSLSTFQVGEQAAMLTRLRPLSGNRTAPNAGRDSVTERRPTATNTTVPSRAGRAKQRVGGIDLLREYEATSDFKQASTFTGKLRGSLQTKRYTDFCITGGDNSFAHQVSDKIRYIYSLLKTDQGGWKFDSFFAEGMNRHFLGNEIANLNSDTTILSSMRQLPDYHFGSSKEPDALANVMSSEFGETVSYSLDFVPSSPKERIDSCITSFRVNEPMQQTLNDLNGSFYESSRRVGCTIHTLILDESNIYIVKFVVIDGDKFAADEVPLSKVLELVIQCALLMKLQQKQEASDLKDKKIHLFLAAVRMQEEEGTVASPQQLSCTLVNYEIVLRTRMLEAVKDASIKGICESFQANLEE